MVLFIGTTAGEAWAARLSLVETSKRGALVVSPPVYGELVEAPGRAVKEIDAFLSRTRVEVDWGPDEDTWLYGGFCVSGACPAPAGAAGRPPVPDAY